MLIAATLRFLALVVGTGLHLFLAVLLARKRERGATEWLLLAVVCSAGLFHAASAAAFFYRINTGLESGAFLEGLGLAASLGVAMTPSFLLHLCLVWAGVRGRWGFLSYALVPLTWWLFASDRTGEVQVLLGVSLLAAAFACGLAARGSEDPLQRRLLRWLTLSVAAPAVALLGGGSPALITWSALLPPFCFAYFVYRYDLFGLFISRRIVFALNLGLFAAFYLFLVRRLAGFFEDEFNFLGPLAEILLISAAALVFLPLYAWINRFLSKKAQVYADFSKRLIQEAARVLEIDKRAQYVAEQVGQTFQLRRVLLITGAPRLKGLHGSPDPEPGEEDLARLEGAAKKTRSDFIHVQDTEDAESRRILKTCGFNYVFPLWYENRLTGLLLLDNSPKLFLDDDEEVLTGLCRQISQSIETGRIVEEKIHLEKALLDQQHLARLGKAAAAIAHEVKNPLSSIKTLAQLMREDAGVAERYGRDLNYMVKEVDRLNGSVQQLLSFAKPPRDVKTDVNLSEILRTTARVLARQDNEGVTVEYVEGPAISLTGSDPQLLDQIVLNLALNAIQASGPGESVRLGCETAENGKVAFHIDDEGPGIPPELRQQIFEPFYTTKQKGTGLGLAIVKKNLASLHGEIELTSPFRNGRGTRVTVKLPLA